MTAYDRYSDLCATLGIRLHQYARETYTRQLAVEQVSGPELDKSSRGFGGEAMFLT
jgi:hypothetical protein